MVCGRYSSNILDAVGRSGDRGRHTSESPSLPTMLFAFGEHKTDTNDVLDQPAESGGPDEGIALGVQDLFVALQAVDENGIRVGKPEVAYHRYLGPPAHPRAEGLFRMARCELVDGLAEEEVVVLARGHVVSTGEHYVSDASMAWRFGTFGPGKWRSGET